MVTNILSTFRERGALPSAPICTRRIFCNDRRLRVCFLNKIQDWIFKYERIPKWTLHFFTKQIKPRSFESWCVKRTEWNRRIHFQSGFFGSFDAPWSERSWIHLSSKETQNPFFDSFGFKNPMLLMFFFKKRHLDRLRQIHVLRKVSARVEPKINSI